MATDSKRYPMLFGNPILYSFFHSLEQLFSHLTSSKLSNLPPSFPFLAVSTSDPASYLTEKVQSFNRNSYILTTSSTNPPTLVATFFLFQ